MTQDRSNSLKSDGYAAKGFLPELKGRLVSGRLFLEGEGARFDYPGNSVVLPAAGLRVHAGGHNNEQLFFEHSDLPGWSIVSSDSGLLNDPVLRNIPAFAPELRAAGKARRGIPKPIMLGLAFLAVCLALLLLLILQKDRIVELVVSRIPMSWEESLGEQVFQQVTAQGEILEQSDWEPAVREITARLLPVVEQSGYDFRFHIMEDTNVNAFAIPGGHVVILTGLLEAADTAEEVAGVVAHEIAHVTERHSMRQMVQSAGLWVIITALFGDVSGVGAVITEGSQFLARQSFSRDFERDADNKGWDYLVAADINPRGLTRFFEELQAIHESAGVGGMESLSFLNTHPATDERIQRLQEKWDELENTASFVPFEKWPNPE